MKLDKNYLDTAISEYRSILKNKEVSGIIRDQSMYKLGKSLELAGKEDEALNLYMELIYAYDVSKNMQSEKNQIWTVKAAHEAVSLYLKRDSAEAARSAVKIYSRLIDMGLPLKQEYSQMIEQIKEKYKI